jgi:hypothetical protein
MSTIGSSACDGSRLLYCICLWKFEPIPAVKRSGRDAGARLSARVSPRTNPNCIPFRIARRGESIQRDRLAAQYPPLNRHAPHGGGRDRRGRPRNYLSSRVHSAISVDQSARRRRQPVIRRCAGESWPPGLPLARCGALSAQMTC